MVQSWFKKHNADFKAILKPVVDKVEEDRKEIFGESKLKESTASTIITQLESIYDNMLDVRIKLSNNNLKRNSKEDNTIARLLSNIYWELDYLEDDGYFNV